MATGNSMMKVKRPLWWRRRSIWLLPLALLIFIVLSDLFGWAYLRAPAAAFLSGKMERRVELGSPFRLHLRRTIPIRIGSLFIAAPDWSQEPHFVDIRGLEADVDWGVLMGKQPVIRRLAVAQADIRAERDSKGRASWTLGDEDKAKTDEEGPSLPVIERLSIGDASIVVEDALSDLDLQVEARTREGEPGTDREPGGGLVASGKGSWKGDPVAFKLQTAGLLRVLEGGALTEVDLEGKLKSTELTFKGSVSDLTRFQKVSGSVTAKGASLGDLTAIPGLTLPTTPSYRLEGQIERDGSTVNVEVTRVEIGSSSMVAKLEYDGAGSPPILRGSIDASKLALQDLGPTIGTTGARRAKAAKENGKTREPARSTPPAGKDPGASRKTADADKDGATRDGASPATPSRVLPTREFDVPALRAMNADVAFDLQKLDLGTEALRPLSSLKARLLLEGGVLRLQDLKSALAGGTVTGTIMLDASATDKAPAFDAKLRWKGVDLKNWLNVSGGDTFVAGRFSGETVLKGTGRSTAGVLESLSGNVKGHIDGGSLSHQLVEIAGLDAAQALGVMFAGDKPLELSCALVDLTADKGTLRSNLFVLNTTDTVFFLQGSVNLRDEKLDLRLVQSPKDWSPLSLRSPITISGTLEDPAIGVEAAPLALKLLASAVLAAVAPVAAILPLIEGKDNSVKEGCAPAIEQVKTKSAELKAAAPRPSTGADEGKPPVAEGSDGDLRRPGRIPGERP